MFRFYYRAYLDDLKAAINDSEQPYTGSHGLRWDYIQKAFRQAKEQGLGFGQVLKVVLMELGHSRKLSSLHYLK